MTCCTKKQIENKKDGTQLERCVNNKAKSFLAVVNNDVCGMCPVRAACAGEKPPQGRYVEHIAGYPLCHYRHTNPDGKHICQVTGLEVDREICNRCDEETRDRVAKLPDKLKGYAAAIKRWVAAGRPTRSEEDQKRILEEHCHKCEKYDREKDACMNCGCSLAQTGNPLTSKLAMGTESCPLGRW
jgi:hypothetical protein